MKQELENVVEINLSTQEVKETKLNLTKEQLDLSATILTNILLDYVNNGGDINNITPQTVFGKKEQL